MNPNDYDEDGNNIVPCPICGDVYCPSKEDGFECPENAAFAKEAEQRMTDVVYVVGTGSKWGNNELRYSLRSLEHFPHRNVVIVGELPEWCQNVIHIDQPDMFANVHGGKYKNVMKKTLAACQDDRVSENFVLMNDDFFFLQDCTEIKPYSIGSLEVQIDQYTNDNRNQYGNALLRTKRILHSEGILNAASYAIHYPIVYNKQKFVAMTEKFDWLAKPASWRTIYGNLYFESPIYRDDPKINNEDQFEIFLKLGNDFLSTSDSVVLLPKFQNWLAERFLNKSMYEI